MYTQNNKNLLFPGKSSKKLYSYYLDGTKVSFTIQPVPKDGVCGFRAMGLDPAEAIQTLIDYITVNTRVQYNQINNNNNEWEAELEAAQKKQQVIKENPLLQKVKSLIISEMRGCFIDHEQFKSRFSFSNTYKMMYDYYRLSDETNNNTFDQHLQSYLEQNLLNYLKEYKKQVTNKYTSSTWFLLIPENNIGGTLIEALAHIHQIELEIYQYDAERAQTLQRTFSVKPHNSKRTARLLYQDSHFDALNLAVDNTINNNNQNLINTVSAEKINSPEKTELIVNNNFKHGNSCRFNSNLPNNDISELTKSKGAEQLKVKISNIGSFKKMANGQEIFWWNEITQNNTVQQSQPATIFNQKRKLPFPSATDNKRIKLCDSNISVRIADPYKKTPSYKENAALYAIATGIAETNELFSSLGQNNDDLPTWGKRIRNKVIEFLKDNKEYAEEKHSEFFNMLHSRMASFTADDPSQNVNPTLPSEDLTQHFLQEKVDAFMIKSDKVFATILNEDTVKSKKQVGLNADQLEKVIKTFIMLSDALFKESPEQILAKMEAIFKKSSKPQTVKLLNYIEAFTLWMPENNQNKKDIYQIFHEWILKKIGECITQHEEMLSLFPTVFEKLYNAYSHSIFNTDEQFTRIKFYIRCKLAAGEDVRKKGDSLWRTCYIQYISLFENDTIRLPYSILNSFANFHQCRLKIVNDRNNFLFGERNQIEDNNYIILRETSPTSYAVQVKKSLPNDNTHEQSFYSVSMR